MQINSFSQVKMMNKSFPVLPVPDIIENNLNHSFKVRKTQNFEITLFTFSIFFSSTSGMTTKE
jgi:hypothetical protein